MTAFTAIQQSSEYGGSLIISGAIVLVYYLLHPLKFRSAYDSMVRVRNNYLIFRRYGNSGFRLVIDRLCLQAHHIADIHPAFQDFQYCGCIPLIRLFEIAQAFSVVFQGVIKLTVLSLCPTEAAF